MQLQGGDPTETGKGGESIWGMPFKDEIQVILFYEKFYKIFQKFRVHISTVSAGWWVWPTGDRTPIVHSCELIFGILKKMPGIRESCDQSILWKFSFKKWKFVGLFFLCLERTFWVNKSNISKNVLKIRSIFPLKFHHVCGLRPFGRKAHGVRPNGGRCANAVRHRECGDGRGGGSPDEAGLIFENFQRNYSLENITDF